MVCTVFELNAPSIQHDTAKCRNASVRAQPRSYMSNSLPIEMSIFDLGEFDPLASGTLPATLTVKSMATISY
jgi:hypothetical protein